jgi:hypothetical protein
LITGNKKKNTIQNRIWKQIICSDNSNQTTLFRQITEPQVDALEQNLNRI